MKKLLILISLLILWNSIIVIAQECVDSDGGIEYYTDGFINVGGAYYADDECNDNLLVELFCKNDVTQLPAGYSCDENDVCTTQFECECDGDACGVADCESGCNLNNNCVPIGIRANNQYCDVDNVMKNHKSEEFSCNNNYECVSNVCINSKCIEPNFIQKIINWFIRLFGG